MNPEALAAFREGALEERERIRSIVELPQARGREGAALQIALTGVVPRVTAIALLSNMPAGEPFNYTTRTMIPRHLRLAIDNSKDDLINEIFA